MEERTNRSILVGVTAAGENTGALRFAAEEAERENSPVTLAHAVHQVVPHLGTSMLLSAEALQAVGDRHALEVADEFRPLNRGGVPVTTSVRTGHPVNVLVDLSSTAKIAVLQCRSLSKLNRLRTGSTLVGVAAHAHCPVISVPASWTPPRTAGRVTVGVHEDGTPQSVLDVAFAEAAARNAPLHLFHAWRLAEAYADLAPRSTTDSWSTQAQEALAEQLAPLREAYPDVPVDTEVRYEWPADAIVELAATSHLLVVGRHSTLAPLLQRIGSLVRTALIHASCPVMVVPVERADGLSHGTRVRRDPRTTV